MIKTDGRIRVDQLFFYLAFFLYLLDAILNASLYINIFPRTMFRLIELASFGICVMKWLLTEQFTMKNLRSGAFCWEPAQ